jgi:hypothetical protein
MVLSLKLGNITTWKSQMEILSQKANKVTASTVDFLSILAISNEKS